MYFTVHEDFEGVIAVSSFMGRNKAEEKRFALSNSKEVHLITTDHDRAQEFAAKLRRIPRAPIR